MHTDIISVILSSAAMLSYCNGNFQNTTEEIQAICDEIPGSEAFGFECHIKGGHFIYTKEIIIAIQKE